MRRPAFECRRGRRTSIFFDGFSMVRAFQPASFVIPISSFCLLEVLSDDDDMESPRWTYPLDHSCEGHAVNQSL
jgi:hypothetical protein